MANKLRMVDQQISDLRSMGYEVTRDYVPQLDEEIVRIALMGEEIAAGRVNLKGELELIVLQEDGVDATEFFEKWRGIRCLS